MPTLASRWPLPSPSTTPCHMTGSRGWSHAEDSPHWVRDAGKEAAMDGPNPSIKHPMPMHTRVGFLKPLIDGREHRDRRFHLLRHPRRAGPLRRGMRAAPLSVHRRQADHRQVLRDRRGRALHHERRQPCHVGLFDLSVQHLRPWLGEGLRPGRPGRASCAATRWSATMCGSAWRRSSCRASGSATASIVAARSVVSHDVPPYAIVAGNPAKVVKARFDAGTTRRLLAIAWWDWPVDKITPQPERHSRRRHRPTGGSRVTKPQAADAR